jgi:N-acetylglucosaminyl-diphospho-decaprenol L-rhamnosyltransferase
LGISRIWPGNPINRRYRCLDLDLNLPAIVDQPAGAFLMIRRDAWQAVGGFDESFHPVWFEDVDFCKRLRDAGYFIEYVPAARARHTGGHSVRNVSFECRQVYWYASLLKYASKHFTRLENIGVSASVMLGAVPRVIMGILKEQRFQIFAAFGKVIRLAASNLASSRAGGMVNSPVAFVKSRRGSTVAQNSTVE